jgi:hypothetical protein
VQPQAPVVRQAPPRPAPEAQRPLLPPAQTKPAPKPVVKPEPKDEKKNEKKEDKKEPQR